VAAELARYGTPRAERLARGHAEAAQAAKGAGYLGSGLVFE